MRKNAEEPRSKYNLLEVELVPLLQRTKTLLLLRYALFGYSSDCYTAHCQQLFLRPISRYQRHDIDDYYILLHVHVHRMDASDQEARCPCPNTKVRTVLRKLLEALIVA